MFRVFFALLFISFNALADNCSDLYKQHLATDAKLTYEKFDQTMGEGFRALEKEKCFPEAANLISFYIKETQNKEISLRWHLAQMRALSGDYQSAIDNAKLSLVSSEVQAKFPIKWNDFVEANIGFWERDKDKLVRYRNEVSTGAKIKPNEINLVFLDRLINNFSETYQVAMYGNDKGS